MLLIRIIICSLPIRSRCSSVFFFLMIRRPPRSTQSRSSAASDVYKRQQLRYRAEVECQGRSPAFVDHEARRIDDPADRGALHVYLTQAGKVAAAVRVIVGPATGMSALNLSLIHISEPTRPY
eukprot:TRINITY_DN2705_c0_g1_i2.p1 TRINITY_DN2705_c0_g1~~TRINITY_DN2705_c0_g1_i2.p1  ORF type:complete len:123 (-),score=41.71 TRINITY_DN2705_c0_g1_i2:106-474(-)